MRINKILLSCLISFSFLSTPRAFSLPEKVEKELSKIAKPSEVLVYLPMDMPSKNVEEDLAAQKTVKGTYLEFEKKPVIRRQTGGKAIKFDGKKSRLEFDGTHFDLSFPLTISAWVKPDSLPGKDKVFSIVSKYNCNKNRSYSLDINSKGNIEFWYSQDGSEQAAKVRTSKTLDKRKWQHVTVTVDKDLNCIIFIDGEAAAESKLPKPKIFESKRSARFVVGARHVAGYLNEKPACVFQGEIDSVLILNKALEPKQVSDLMSKKL